MMTGDFKLELSEFPFEPASPINDCDWYGFPRETVELHRIEVRPNQLVRLFRRIFRRPNPVEMTYVFRFVVDG